MKPQTRCGAARASLRQLRNSDLRCSPIATNYAPETTRSRRSFGFNCTLLVVPFVHPIDPYSIGLRVYQGCFTRNRLLVQGRVYNHSLAKRRSTDFPEADFALFVGHSQNAVRVTAVNNTTGRESNTCNPAQGRRTCWPILEYGTAWQMYKAHRVALPL